MKGFRCLTSAALALFVLCWTATASCDGSTWEDEEQGLILEKLFEREAMWREHTSDIQQFGCANLFPTKKGCDPLGDIGVAGDSVLFNSLLCYSGEASACRAVRKSQDSSGRFWRSPLHIGGRQIPDSGSFSKDHVVGLLLYFAVSKNRNAAQRWLWSIQEDANLVHRSLEIGKEIGEDVAREASNGAECVGQGLPCLVSEYQEDWEDLSYEEKIACGIITVAFPPAGVVCPAVVSNGKKLVKSGHVPRYLSLYLERVCEEAHCVLTPNLYALMYKTWKYIGLEPSINMKVFRAADGEESMISQIKKVDPGVELHLKAVTALIRRVTHRGATSKMIDAIVEKDDKNPFHLYLDNAPLKKIVEAFAPMLTLTLDDMRANRGHQWTWERDSADEEWRDSMGWDLIFIKNLLRPQLSASAEKYIQETLPMKWSRLRPKLDEALMEMRTAHQATEGQRAAARALVKEVREAVRLVDLSASVLLGLSSRVQQYYQGQCPLNAWALNEAIERAQELSDLVFNELMPESERFFNGSADPARMSAFWDPVLAVYAEDRALLDRLLAGAEADPCVELVSAAKAIALRIESDKVHGLATEIGSIQDAVAASLQASARSKERAVVQSRVTGEAGALSASLRRARIGFHYNRGQALYESLPRLLDQRIESLLRGAGLLNEEERSGLKAQAVQVLTTERNKWAKFVSDFSAAEIVNERQRILKVRAQSFPPEVVEGIVVSEDPVEKDMELDQLEEVLRRA